MTFVSRKSVNRFIEHGLRIIAAKPMLFYHQTLTFPAALTEAKTAKAIFNKFIKSVLKFYQQNDMAVMYVQETRTRYDAIHFHVCFIFFSADKLPFCKSRMRREFRADIFKRWIKHSSQNDSEPVHCANKLEEHEFNKDSMLYFTRALTVDSEHTKRAETNWWGCFNNELILNRSPAPTKQEKKSVFDLFFKKPSPKQAIKLRQTGKNELIRFDKIKCAKSFVQDYSADYILAPWLNLLFYLPISRALQGQAELVWRYTIDKSIHDTPQARHLLEILEAKLKEIFSRSFLFQSELPQIEYRDDCPRVISLETLEVLYHQILNFDFSVRIAGEKCLCQLVREAWQHTQTPIPHMTLALAGDDFLAPQEVQKNLTWLWDSRLLLCEK